jgi:hypothetical protein
VSGKVDGIKKLDIQGTFKLNNVKLKVVGPKEVDPIPSWRCEKE